MPRFTARFSHVGLFVRHLDIMERFYAGFMGLTVTDRGDLGTVRLVFLSGDPDEHHQIVLASGRPAAVPFNVVNQLSFKLDGLGELRRLHRGLAGQPVSEVAPVTHGMAWSVYFRDPEGNRVEAFVDTPWYVAQPVREPLDLARPEAEILAETEALCRRLPGFRPRADWRAEIAAKMAAPQ